MNQNEINNGKCTFHVLKTFGNLHFGGVDWKCKIYINDIYVGAHSGGYSPFYFDITNKLKKGIKRQKDYIIINQHLWEWFSLNYSGGPEIKIIGDKTYTSTFLSPITENNEINHNNKIKDNNENINNYQQDKHAKEIKSKNINKLREKQPKEDKRKSVISFEQERNLLNNSNNFNKIKQE